MELKTFDLKDFSRVFLDDSRCDNPIEDLFHYDFQKVMSEKGTIHRQVECLTPIGAFRLDFMLQLPDRRAGFECHGKDFYDKEADTYHKEYNSFKGYNRKVRRLKFTSGGHYHDFSVTRCSWSNSRKCSNE